MVNIEMNNAFERKVEERLQEYLQKGEDHDTVLEMICRDFPCMDEKTRNHCADIVYRHYFTNEEGKVTATLKHAELMNSSSVDDTLDSHIGCCFHLNKGDDLIAVVLMENPMYLHGEADIHLSFHIGDKKVNEFRHTMTSEERRSIYHIPLNVAADKTLADMTLTSMEVSIVDENVKGIVYDFMPDVYYGGPDPTEIFSVDKIELFENDEHEDEEMFDVCWTEYLTVGAKVRYRNIFDRIDSIEAKVSLSPIDSTDERETLVNHLILFTSDDNEEILEGAQRIFYTDEEYSDNKYTPIYNPEPGTYVLRFYIWDTLLWSKEIEFYIPDDDEYEEDKDYEADEKKWPTFDELLDEIIENIKNQTE